MEVEFNGKNLYDFLIKTTKVDEGMPNRESRELEELAKAGLTLPNFSPKSSRQVFAKYVRRK
ncbi:hypothetical protein MOE57_14530 [Bacillus inaquosorum]|uniref:hypothetical protein n=1 Tax=Bacillus inaquosorum TaxID=483913 RepID=UPI002280B7CC|nr:hypothetical protein [Bacillus inaquosorum]MCY9083684.1 hypothetical protein [Bacillus inaquosorum]